MQIFGEWCELYVKLYESQLQHVKLAYLHCRFCPGSSRLSVWSPVLNAARAFWRFARLFFSQNAFSDVNRHSWNFVTWCGLRHPQESTTTTTRTSRSIWNRLMYSRFCYSMRLTYASQFCNVNWHNYTGWAKKNAHYTLVHIFAKYWPIFTDVLSWKFAIKLFIKIPPHLRCAATLPCEMLMFANRCIPSSRW